jgi:hypothetical protein
MILIDFLITLKKLVCSKKFTLGISILNEIKTNGIFFSNVHKKKFKKKNAKYGTFINKISKPGI